MTTTVGLIAFGAAVGAFGPALLERWRWPTRSPRLGIVAWQAMTISVFVSFVLAGVTLAAHAVPKSGLVGTVLHACSVFLSDENGANESAVLPALGAVLAAGFISVLFWAARGGLRRQAADARRQQAALRLVCSPHGELDVAVLDHEVPTVFCVPGRGPEPRVVVSRGALEVLTPSQLGQVLAHERAHLAAHHHLVLRWAEAFAVVLRGRFGTARALGKLEELVEMHADDAAGTHHRRELAEAVVALAGGARPAVALGAGGCALRRVQRLTAPAEPVRPRIRAAVLLGSTGVLMVPALIATLPGLVSLFAEACPFLF